MSTYNFNKHKHIQLGVWNVLDHCQLLQRFGPCLKHPKRKQRACLSICSLSEKLDTLLLTVSHLRHFGWLYYIKPKSFWAVNLSEIGSSGVRCQGGCCLLRLVRRLCHLLHLIGHPPILGSFGTPSKKLIPWECVSRDWQNCLVLQQTQNSCFDSLFRF